MTDEIVVLGKDVNDERVIVSVSKKMLEKMEDFILWKKIQDVEDEELMTVDEFLKQLWTY